MQIEDFYYANQNLRALEVDKVITLQTYCFDEIVYHTHDNYESILFCQLTSCMIVAKFKLLHFCCKMT